MTNTELQRRGEKSLNLRVLKSNGNFFVESHDGLILYKVNHNGEPDKFICTCGDYARGIKNDPNFQCKHIMAVINIDPNETVESGEFLAKKKPKLDERFIKTIEGRDFVLYSGLLDLAHQKGLLKIEVEALQFPTKENGYFAICKASAISKNGEVFVDVGDANPTNCNAKVGKHLLRMASTRAKARSLRDMTDIGLTALEELGDFDEVIGEDSNGEGRSKRGAPRKFAKAPDAQPAPAQESKPTLVPKPPVEEQKEKAEGNGSNGNGKAVAKPKEEGKQDPKTEKKAETTPKMSSAQKNAIYNLSRRRGISVEELEGLAQKTFGVAVESLSSGDASSFIRTLQQSN